MKTKLCLLSAAIVLILSILACNVTVNTAGSGETVSGSGTPAEQDRTIHNITAVELTMQGTLYITQGGDESLQVVADDNLMAYIETNQQGGILVIETRRGVNLRPKTPIKYYLTVDKLSKVLNTSSGDIQAGDLQADSLSITVSSSGSIVIDSLDGQTLRVEISSSGDIEIKAGQVQEQTIQMSSSGLYKARELESAKADVTINSNGDATINVSDELDGRISSSGNIYYIGSPEVDVSTSSSGQAIQINK